MTHITPSVAPVTGCNIITIIVVVVVTSRLTESEGVITDDANLSSSSNYSSDSTCLFFIEADRPDVSINLKVNVLHLECLWDYVQVFDGDSVYAHKIAAYT